MRKNVLPRNIELNQFVETLTARLEKKPGRDPQRICPLLNRIAEVWERNPDMRLGQLLVNAAEGDLFYVEDELLVQMVEGLDKTLRKR